MERWYVLRTKRRAEAQVSRLLSAHGLTCYYPQLVRWTGTRRRVEPLFPGYIFVRLGDCAAHWKLARWSPGVAYVVGSEQSVVPVPDAVVAALAERVARESAREGATLAADDRALITGEPLAGLEAAFDRLLTPSGRSRVLLDALRRYPPVEVDLAELRQVAGSAECSSRGPGRP